MRNVLKLLWSAAWKLSPEERRRTVRVVSAIVILSVGLVLFAAGRASATSVAAENPIWEAVLQARMVLVRLVLSVAIVPISLVAAVGAYQVLENTELGRRLVVWDPKNDAYVKAAKTRNAGTLLGALLASAVAGLLVGALR